MHLLLILHVITPWVTVRATQAETTGVEAYREVALLRGEGIEQKVRLQRERDGRASLQGTTDSSVNQQHRTTICGLKHARSSCKPAIYMDSGFLVVASLGVLGKEDWALVVGGGRVRGTGSKGSGSTWREGLEKKVEEPQEERDGRDSLLLIGTTGSSVDHQNRTTFCALKHARSSYKPANSMGSGFLVDAPSGVLGGDEWARSEVAGSWGTGSSSSNSMWGKGIEEVEKLQSERDGNDSLIGTTDGSVDQQLRTTSCALKHARSSFINQPFCWTTVVGRFFFGGAWEGGLGPCGQRWQSQWNGK